MDKEQYGLLLRELRNSKKKTQQQIADYLGITRGAYSHFENGRNEPDIETLINLANYYEISLDKLLGRKDIKNQGHKLSTDSLIKIPVLGRIVASAPEGMETDFDGQIGIEESIVKKYGIENLFALKVNGDSMNKLIIPGSIAIIHRTTEWNDGDICAVIINGYEATLKRVFKRANSIRFEPDSWNPNQHPWEYTEDMDIEVIILGVYIYSVSGL